MMNGHDIGQDDRSDKMATTTMVAAVDRRGRDVRKMSLQEHVLHVVHRLHCGCRRVLFSIVAKRFMDYDKRLLGREGLSVLYRTYIAEDHLQSALLYHECDALLLVAD